MRQTILIAFLVAGCADEPDPAYIVDAGGDADTDTDTDTDADTDLTCGDTGRPVAGFCWYRSAVGRHCLEACEVVTHSSLEQDWQERQSWASSSLSPQLLYQ